MSVTIRTEELQALADMLEHEHFSYGNKGLAALSAYKKIQAALTEQCALTSEPETEERTDDGAWSPDLYRVRVVRGDGALLIDWVFHQQTVNALDVLCTACATRPSLQWPVIGEVSVTIKKVAEGEREQPDAASLTDASGAGL